MGGSESKRADSNGQVANNVFLENMDYVINITSKGDTSFLYHLYWPQEKFEETI